jgi:iron(III) transport system ATP-binding protein
MASAITVESVTKEFGGGVRGLDGLNLGVDAGEFLVLLGPSGSGKTTLLRCLAGIERISGGTIRFGDTVVAEGRRHVPPEDRDLAMVFQDYALWPHLSVRDNVAFAVRRRRLGRSDRNREALAVLDRVGLGHLVDRYPSQLSGGEQQRVALARALAGRTGVILFDEPLSNLDANLRERLRVEIATLVREAGATAVYITHDQVEAFALADRVGVLEEGSLVQIGTPEDIYGSPATPFVARFTGLAGEFRADVRANGVAGTVELQIPDFVGRRPLRARAITELGSAPTAVVSVRPTAISLCRHDADEHHAIGTVVDVAFRDRGYEHAIDIPGHPRLTGVLHEHRIDRGARVGVHFNVDGCLAYPDRESVSTVT